jgi:dihydropteroate synthase
LLRALLPDLGQRTLVMGVLNVTPDSFSDGGRYLDPDAAVAHARRMQAEGADLLDIGGESTRPGAAPVDADGEKRRVLPVIERIAAEVGLPISLDTTKAEVARAGIAAGAALINDVSAGTLDAALLPAVADLGVPLCLMHLPVRPEAMGWSRAALPEDIDVTMAVIAWLRERVAAAQAAGVSRDNLLVDPGFGFGKSVAQNLAVVRRLSEIRAGLGGLPVVLGTSRKSTLGRVLGPEAEAADPERLAGTAASVALGAAFGADIVRVHDVGFLVRVVRVSDAILGRGGGEG